ncbi:alpha-galactosidase [Hymenobacter sp. BT770]|uniref:alpha-galactosidase n=1 Tax=Hymenobacter sp. BT770 TaxID=2886942 RepID=UPI001D0F609F|nr:alpha-galactosidase [Hymenobacter sp. BT770]MCC3154403.1 alpha-galactosidase [Hymenobacter sp. BT770]MDO3416274.1 alpha-galactosidase [Hymenobacter sp. BT770]
MALRYLCCFLLLTRLVPAIAQSTPPISVETEHVSLVLAVGDKQRIFQTYLGPRLAATDHKLLPNRHEAYVPAGTDNLFEPALRVVHADGNPSMALAFADVQTSKTGDDVTTTTIHLRDPSYPVDVRLHFTAYYKEDVIKTWTEITHRENRPVVLTSYASAMLHFDARQYWLTQFHGDWAEEAKQEESRLTSGTKVIDTKLGTRAGWYQTPSFFLGLDKPAEETTGEVLAGSLAWTGNFRLAFELDNQNSLRVSAGINPYASEYTLPANQPFVTPEFIFTYSTTGKGQASRNLHRWARQHGGTLDGTQPRLTLLNNWESTFFDFNEAKLDGIMADAAKLGVDLFLLDDGWFGNKYPRNGDTQGLGDWQPTKTKLPNGVGHLVKTASKEGIKFGIWLEPEMVNPKSELAERHPDWLLKLPNRPDDLYRHQLVLDLNNPKVQDFVFNTVTEQLSKGVAYVKWDCNRMISSGYSQYLGKDQSHLYVDYVLGLYKVLERVRQQYPHLPMMLCSGGGARAEYGGLKYFTEFWPSDNTDAFERIFIQWGFSQFFPSNTIASHVTNWNRQHTLKFRTDVAMMGKLGYDIEVEKMTPDELKFSQQAVKDYKRLSPVIWQGDLFRLRSPYEGNQASLMYVDEAQRQAVVFGYNLHTRFLETVLPVKLQGLDPTKRYKVAEINLMPGQKSQLPAHGQTYSGDYLMKVGVLLSDGEAKPLTSHVLELTAQ